MTTFDQFTPAALQFLADLEANNNRAWFADNKAVYEAEIKAPAARFADLAAARLSQRFGRALAPKIYRIHRDVRFAKDKTPYNPHVHISFGAPGHEDAPMWFFGLGVQRLSLGCGVFAYSKPALERFRAAIAGPSGAALASLLDQARAAGLRVSEPELKTIPRGFDRDHPHGADLRRKGVSVWRDFDDLGFVTAPNLVGRALAVFEDMEPMYRFLNGVVAVDDAHA